MREYGHTFKNKFGPTWKLNPIMRTQEPKVRKTTGQHRMVCLVKAA